MVDAAQSKISGAARLERARELVMRFGWNATSYQIINPGIHHWFAKDGDAVVGFVNAQGVRVVAGAPVCSKERLREVASEFERDAELANQRVCYFCAEARLESVYAASPGHTRVLLGAQPVWRPAGWAAMAAKNKSLRAQLNRARNKGVTIAEWTSEKAQNNSALIDCLHEWLASKPLPPLHFLVEPNTLAHLSDRRIFVAEREKEIVGFVLLSPVTNRRGWLFEQYPHRPKAAPNGTVELMIDTAMRALAETDYDYATLGLSPLSTRAEVAPFNNPLWLRVMLAWMRKHGQRFYNFDGLDRFKSKLRPDRWEPVFAISNQPRFSIGTLYAIAAAFSENAPFCLISVGLRRALAAELKWLGRAISD
jgi:phosphatidylglycerol lysyltransferase